MRSRGLMNPLGKKFSYSWAGAIPRLKNSCQDFFMKLG